MAQRVRQKQPGEIRLRPSATVDQFDFLQYMKIFRKKYSAKKINKAL